MNDMNVQIYDAHPTPASLHQEVLRGLQSSPKAIAPKFFYDARGSQLFDAICETPEYYPARIEKQILRRYAGEIADIVGEGCLLIEPGSGSCQKVRLLLEDLKPSIYMPMEICHDHLLKAAQALVNEYDWLELSAVCADFTQLNKIPDIPDKPHRLAFFPGSTIGNFEPSQAVNFMRNIAHLVGHQGGLLIGVDMKKPAKVLNAAYNDAQGLTADFNLNLLGRINRELNTDFNLENFKHKAFYNESEGRVEMHLVCERGHGVTLGKESFILANGEHIHTENSYKYSIDEFHELARMAGFEVERVWTDDEQLFSVHYLQNMAV